VEISLTLRLQATEKGKDMLCINNGIIRHLQCGLFFVAWVFGITIPVLAQKQDGKQAGLIEVASFGHYRPIGVAVAKQGNRLFVSFPHGHPFRYALIEVKDGKETPFPDLAWNKFVSRTDKTHFANVQDLYADDENNLWVLDSSPNRGSSSHGSPAESTGYFKLVKIDLTTDSVKRIYYFEDDKSALNDVNVDNDKGLAYLSDPGLRAIVVLNLKTGKSRVVLKDDPSTMAQPGFILHLDGVDVVNQQGHPFVSNVNGIALTPDHKYFYFRAISQKKLYRIETQYLADTTLSENTLSAKVEMVAETGVCHGMIADAHGNVYLSSSPDHSIKYVSPGGKLHTLVTDQRLIWPDSFGIGSDGYLYVSCSQINRSPGFNHGIDKTAYPYRVYKVKLPFR
jgi:sugar lactone lactonase YvrE